MGVLFGQSHDEVKDRAFARFYQDTSNIYSPSSSQIHGSNNSPHAGHDFANYEATTALPSLVSSAYGTVLDLGPGVGNQLDYFDASKVNHVYGVEPNTAFTDFFMKRLRETKLGQDAKYTLVPCGIENHEMLHSFGAGEGSVDCIVSMQVLVRLSTLLA